jgi:hypothetical protein
LRFGPAEPKRRRGSRNLGGDSVRIVLNGRDESFADYERFAAILGAEAKRDELVAARVPGDVLAYLGWMTGDAKYLAA